MDLQKFRTVHEAYKRMNEYAFKKYGRADKQDLPPTPEEVRWPCKYDIEPPAPQPHLPPEDSSGDPLTILDEKDKDNPTPNLPDLQPQYEFRFKEYWWQRDWRDNPYDGKEPNFGLYEDHISVLLERAYFTWVGLGW